MRRSILIIIFILALFLSTSTVKAETVNITTNEQLINTIRQLIVLLMQQIEILQKQIALRQTLLTPTTTTTTTTKPQICSIGWKCNPNWKGYQSEDCSWTNLTYCEYGCENGECITPTTTTTTLSLQQLMKDSDNIFINVNSFFNKFCNNNEIQTKYINDPSWSYYHCLCGCRYIKPSSCICYMM